MYSTYIQYLHETCISNGWYSHLATLQPTCTHDDMALVTLSVCRLLECEEAEGKQASMEEVTGGRLVHQHSTNRHVKKLIGSG